MNEIIELCKRLIAAPEFVQPAFEIEQETRDGKDCLLIRQTRIITEAEHSDLTRLLYLCHERGIGVICPSAWNLAKGA